MEEKIITLKQEDYDYLKKLLESEQKTLYFRCAFSDEMISLPNINRIKSNNSSNEKNIVEKWMNDIVNLADIGTQYTKESVSEKYFSMIKSYCNAVIISVTSS